MPAVFFYACRKGLQDKNRLFLVLWFISGLLMLSFAGTKRTIYLVPLFSSISILTGSWLNDVESRLINGRFARISQWVILCVSSMSIMVIAGAAYKLELIKTVPFLLFIPLLAIGYIFVFRSFVKCNVIKLCGLPVLMSLTYIIFVLVFVSYINERKSFKPFCNELNEILAVRESAIYAFQPDEAARAVVPFYTGHKLVPVNSLEDVRLLQCSEKVLMFVTDMHKNMPNYNSLKTVFPYVMLSEVVGKRRNMKLLSNYGKKG